jgi:endonuclease I
MARRLVHTTLSIFGLLLFLVSSHSSSAPPANYYTTVNPSSSTNLRASLHPVIDDHTRFPYTSSATDTWNILEAADEDHSDSSRVTTIYKNASYAKVGGGNNNYNREHSWPKSYGFPNDGSSNYAYTDAHHLFIADSRYNSSRGNEYFDNCNSGCNEFSTDENDGQGGVAESNFSDSNSWEVWSQRRGDIARAMFYMDIRYEGGNHNVTGYSEPNLILTNNASQIQTTGSNASVAYMGLLSVLLEWHEQDPVSDDERARNDVVFSYQGNRNPFVDHPEWVNCLYNNVCSGGSGGGNSNTDNLENGETQSGLNASQGSWIYRTIDIPVNASNFVVSISGGSGDADLYTRLNSDPTTSNYICRPYLNGNNESCTISSPSAGRYHIGIRAYNAFSNLSLTASYQEGGSEPQGETQTYTNISGSQGAWRNYPVTIPSGANSLTARISGGSGDADIYVRRASLPTLSSYDCRPWLAGNSETCTFSNPQNGQWYVSIYGYSAYSGVTLIIEHD